MRRQCAEFRTWPSTSFGTRWRTTTPSSPRPGRSRMEFFSGLRVPPKVKIAGISKDELKEATKWVGGLDRIHRARGILMCYDLTATPFAPTGRKSGDETLFG